MGAVRIPRATADRIVAECLLETHAIPGNKQFVGYRLGVSVFDMLRMVGADVPSSEDLTKNYWQTTGPVIWAGTNPLEVEYELEAWAHEMTHAQQWWRDMVRMPIWYVQHGEMRGARYESEAYARGIAVSATITGQIPEALPAVQARYEHGYWLDAGAIQVTTAILEGHLTSLSRGIIPPGVCRTIIRKLYRENPDYLDAKMLGLIQQNNPEVLQ